MGKPALKTSHAVGDHQLRTLTRTVSEWMNWFAWKDKSHSVSLLHNWTVVTMLWRSGYNSAHMNFFKEDSRVEFNNDANASLVMEAMLSSIFVWKKSYSTNMCNLNNLCHLIKKLWPLLHYLWYAYCHFLFHLGGRHLLHNEWLHKGRPRLLLAHWPSMIYSACLLHNVLPLVFCGLMEDLTSSFMISSTRIFLRTTLTVHSLPRHSCCVSCLGLLCHCCTQAISITSSQTSVLYRLFVHKKPSPEGVTTLRTGDLNV
jgi:hypothetical protein